MKPLIGKPILEMSEAELAAWVDQRRAARLIKLKRKEKRKTTKSVAEAVGVSEASLIEAAKELGVIK